MGIFRTKRDLTLLTSKRSFKIAWISPNEVRTISTWCTCIIFCLRFIPFWMQLFVIWFEVVNIDDEFFLRLFQFVQVFCLFILSMCGNFQPTPIFCKSFCVTKRFQWVVTWIIVGFHLNKYNSESSNKNPNACKFPHRLCWIESLVCLRIQTAFWIWMLQ